MKPALRDRLNKAQAYLAIVDRAGMADIVSRIYSSPKASKPSRAGSIPAPQSSPALAKPEAGVPVTLCWYQDRLLKEEPAATLKQEELNEVQQEGNPSPKAD